MTLLGRALFCLLLPSLGAGCLSRDAEGVPDADPFIPPLPHVQFVLDSFALPTTPTQAQQFGLDLDGDPQGRPDNALGQILSTLASQGADVGLGESSETAILRGRILVLIDLQT